MSIEYTTDFDDIAGIIGTVKGMAKVMNEPRYLDRIITHAYKRTTPEFDTAAAAYGLATGSINHMFEWGTAGINSGRTTRRMQPTDPMSHLWTHHITGNGRNKQASFQFKPSVVPVPPPTVARTGVPREELDKLTGGPYIFSAKAAVMETGVRVTIAPNESEWLFVPFGPGGPHSYDSGRKKKRNFIFTKSPIETIPGKTVAGNFSKFWLVWWGTEGSRVLTDRVQAQIDYQTEQLMAEAALENRAIRPSKLSTRTFELKVKKAQEFARRRLYGRDMMD